MEERRLQGKRRAAQKVIQEDIAMRDNGARHIKQWPAKTRSIMNLIKLRVKSRLT